MNSPYQNLSFSVSLTFDDVLLLPQYSEVLPNEVDTSVSLSKKLHLKIPILSSPMDTVTESEMASVIANEGGMGIIHRNLTVEKQAHEVAKVKSKNKKALVGAAVGVGEDYKKRASALVNEGVSTLVIDTAHGHSKKVKDALQFLRKEYSSLVLIAGNVGTSDGAKFLIDNGADILRVGIGPGSICTTRIVAGVGVPQLSVIMETSKVAKQNNIPIIADGGIKNSADVVKALAAGASVVMLGNLLAGTDESPGELIELHGRKFKHYRGMGSIGAMQGVGGDRYTGGLKATTKTVAEGVVGRVPYRGSLANVISQILGGLRSGMGYVGAKNISELHRKAQFTFITKAGMRESLPHDVQIMSEAMR
ncbi:MAG: IMP dehydrogenase [Ignavibacteriales bacterium]|nr:IMP dehydrogenase [Ignavibacteriales bacterium]